MITVHRYLQQNQKKWDHFISQSNNGTIFHYRDFLNYHIDRQFMDHSLLFTKNGKWIAVFPAAEVIDGNDRVLYSHPGASFGGFVTGHLRYADICAILESFEDYCRTAGFDRVFFIQPPNMYFRRFDETLEYALNWYRYRVTERYISSIIRLDRSADEIISNAFRLKNRTSGFYEKQQIDHQVTFEWKNDFEAYYPILLKNKKRHGSKPTHSLEELYRLDELLPGKLHLLLLYSGEHLIGGTLNIIANERTGIIFYNMIDYRFRSCHPAEFQIFETIRWAKDQDLSFLDFGVSHDPKADDPLSPVPSLIRFKEEFGSAGVIRRVYEKVFGQ